MYDNNDTGVLFKNTQRRDGSNDPHAKGSATIDGKEYWVSAWTATVKKKESKRFGERMQKLTFTLKEDQPARPAGTPAEESPRGTRRSSERRSSSRAGRDARQGGENHG